MSVSKRMVIFFLPFFSLMASCDKDYYIIVESPVKDIPVTEKRIETFTFYAKDNPSDLLSDTKGLILGDSLVSVRIPYLVSSKQLIPTLTFNSDSLYLSESCDSVQFIADGFFYKGKELDFSKDVNYSLYSRKDSIPDAVYTVEVIGFTGLPVMYINTEDNKSITSKDEYVNASISIISQRGNDISCDLDSMSVSIKGRGNSTWNLPKKPYKLKFSKKNSLFGEAKNKEWVLLANYTDKTMIRNATAFHLGDISNLDWTPCSHFVELYLNHHYMGTYQLTEQIKIAKNRVNVTNKGYLLEVDAKADDNDVTFYTTRNKIPFNIKSPKVEKGSNRYNWIKDHIQRIENDLYDGNFLSDTSYYKKYVDLKSFADWYLINEITKNNDAIMWTSCYMNVDSLGVLRMGPIWDFDISLGNVNYNGNMTYDGFWIKNAYFISKLFDDPSFVQLMRNRFNYFKAQIDSILNWINSQAVYLQYSAVENDNVWRTLYTETWPNYAISGSYQNEVAYLKYYLENRMDWLDNNLPQ